MSEMKFGSGSLYLGPTLLADGLSCAPEFEFSSNETMLVNYRLQSEASFSGEVNHIDLGLLNKHFDPLSFTNPFTFEYERYIMIQARWHKKARIRKKWLKRYGMKQDTMQVVCYSRSWSYMSDGSFEIDAENFRYVFRPDQKRRGLKVEL